MNSPQTNKRSSAVMTIIAQNKRYLPHEITTKENSVKLYRKTKDISFVCRRYHISKASLMRWNKRYDGTRESLEARSHRPKRQHPRAHTEKELKWIRDYHRRNPDISVCELYGKLREDKAYSRHQISAQKTNNVQVVRTVSHFKSIKILLFRQTPNELLTNGKTCCIIISLEHI